MKTFNKIGRKTEELSRTENRINIDEKILQFTNFMLYLTRDFDDEKDLLILSKKKVRLQ